MIETSYPIVDDDDWGKAINNMYHTPADADFWPKHLFIKESVAISKTKIYCDSQVHISIKSE